MVSRRTSLRIRFGWHLDGPAFPDEPAIGQLTLGPLGLVHQLALRVGLTGLAPLPLSLRISEYLSVLQILEDGNQFYPKSFSTDKWGTTKAILGLRDQLMAAGFARLLRESDSVFGSDRLKLILELERNFSW